MLRRRLADSRNDGQVRMVDVSAKPATLRIARAEATLRASAKAIRALAEGRSPKGNAAATCRIAAISAAKRADEFVPLAHPIAVTSCEVRVEFGRTEARVETEVKCLGPTGCELEAILAAFAGALALYDMGKPLDRGMEIRRVRLLAKSGGRSGAWSRSGGGSGAGFRPSLPKNYNSIIKNKRPESGGWKSRR